MSVRGAGRRDARGADPNVYQPGTGELEHTRAQSSSQPPPPDGAAGDEQAPPDRTETSASIFVNERYIASVEERRTGSLRHLRYNARRRLPGRWFSVTLAPGETKTVRINTRSTAPSFEVGSACSSRRRRVAVVNRTRSSRDALVCEVDDTCVSIDTESDRRTVTAAYYLGTDVEPKRVAKVSLPTRRRQEGPALARRIHGGREPHTERIIVVRDDGVLRRHRAGDHSAIGSGDRRERRRRPRDGRLLPRQAGDEGFAGCPDVEGQRSADTCGRRLLTGSPSPPPASG